MSNAITITSAQCKRARGMLKWNPQDLASRTRIPVRQIEKFERNQTKLLRPENEEIVDTFHKNGVDFDKNGDVLMKGQKGGSQHQVHYEDATIDITESIIAASQQVPIDMPDSIEAPKTRPSKPV